MPVSTTQSATLDMLERLTVPLDPQQHLTIVLRSLLALRAKYDSRNLNLSSKRDINETAWIKP